MKNKLFLLVSCILYSGCSLACSCKAPLDIQWMDNKANIVFIGELKSKSRFSSFSENKYTFKNLSLIKGKNSSEFKFWSDKSGNSCGAKFKKSEKYILFVYKGDGEKLRTSSCSAWPINESHQHYIDEVNKFYRQNKNGWIEIVLVK